MKKICIAVVFVTMLAIFLPTKTFAASWKEYGTRGAVINYYADMDSISVDEYKPPFYTLSVTVRNAQRGAVNSTRRLKFRYDYDSVLIGVWQEDPMRNQYGYMNVSETSMYPQLQSYYYLALDVWKKNYNIPFGNPKVITKKFMDQGILRFNNKNYQPAIDSFKKVIEIDQKNDEAYGWIGYCHYQLEDYQNAIKYYQKAIELNPKEGSYCKEMGLVYDFGLNQYDTAAEWYNKAITLSTDDYQAYNKLGVIYEKKFGKYQEALDCYKNALKINKKYQLAKDNKKRVEKLLKGKK